MKLARLPLALTLAAPAALAETPSDLGWVKPDPSELFRVFGLRKLISLGPELEPLEAPPFEATAPMISKDGSLAFAATRDGDLHARWIDSGKSLWDVHVGRSGHSFAQYRELLLAGVGTHLVALEAYSGKERWRLDLGGMIGGAITVTGTVAYVPVRPAGVTAVDVVATSVRWRFKRARPEGITVLGQSAVTVDEARGQLYTGLPDGSLAAIALSDGEVRWTATLTSGRRPFRDVDAAPLLTPDGELLAANYDSGLFGLDPDDGRVRWKEPAVTGVTGLTLVMGRVIATDGGAVGLGPKGQVVWRYRPHKGFLSAPMPFGFGMVGFASSSGVIPVLDAVTGKPTQLLSVGPSGVLSPPARLRKDLAILTNRGSLMFFRYGEGSGITR